MIVFFALAVAGVIVLALGWITLRDQDAELEARHRREQDYWRHRERARFLDEERHR